MLDKTDKNTKEKQLVISFAHFGEYNLPIQIILERIFPSAKIILPPNITKKTLELGTLNSPESVCVPFKYHVGNYIEALKDDVDIFFQAASGCRFTYYGELQYQILQDLGYKGKFISLFAEKTLTPKKLYAKLKEAGSKISFLQFIKHFLFTLKMIIIIDKLGEIYRKNVAFEIEKGSFKKARLEMYNEFKEAKGYFNLLKIQKKYLKIYNSIKLDKPNKPIRVMLVGEIYCLLEPSSNYFLEDKLAKNNIEIHRYANLEKSLRHNTYKHQQKIAEASGGYIKYVLDGHGTHSVSKAAKAAKEGFDGIIHLKPFGCIPEISAMPPLLKLGADYEMPIIYLSFDSQTTELGIETRLEAFVDMLKAKIK